MKVKTDNMNELSSLESIAAHLEALEETIISRLLERAQFCENLRVYQPGQSGFSGESDRCLFDIRLRYQEEIDSKFGRFCVPEERPFNKDLPVTHRQVLFSKMDVAIDDYEKVNLTDAIRSSYFELIPILCRPGDDGQYGSTVEYDVSAVQAISRRIHFGSMYIAERKYRENPAVFRKLAECNDTQGILERITRKSVEDLIITRIRGKTYSTQACINRLIRHFVDPEIIVNFYQNTIIPLTKKGEILYILNRRKD